MTSSIGRPGLSGLLAGLPLFAGLAERDLAGLAAASRADRYAPEATLFRQGEPRDRFWILRDGRLKIVHLAEDGREVILEVIAPGEVFGGAVLFMEAHPATARAMTAAETISFPSQVYQQLIGQHPTLAQQLVRM